MFKILPCVLYNFFFGLNYILARIILNVYFIRLKSKTTDCVAATPAPSSQINESENH